MTYKPKVLIVDDRGENLYALENILQGADAEIIRASDGNSALKAILNHDFALAILDVQMPGMDGFELAEFIRSEDKTKNLPIIFLSAAYKEETHIFRGYESGAVDYITKPFDPHTLLNKVKIFIQLEAQKHLLAEQKGELEKLVDELQKALKEIRTLRGIVPICSFCKQIRDDQGYWNQVEAYVSKFTEAEFSHGICPACMKEHYPEYYEEIKNRMIKEK